MKLKELYNRVVETTGLEVVTLQSLQTAVSNCMADLTSRGYRLFKEIGFEDLDEYDIIVKEPGYVEVKIPVAQIRKVLYVKIFLTQLGIVAKRLSLSNPNVQKNWINGRFRTWLGPHKAVFYIKDNHLIIEYPLEYSSLFDFKFGYYSKLVAPVLPTNLNEDQTLENVSIDIREEFEDALVLFAAYFYYSRFVKDTEKIQMYLNNYKYYVEDITHELAYEDEYFEEDSIVHVED
jgi:hypothetical protein